MKKKIILGLIIFGCICTLCGCGKDKKKVNKKDLKSNKKTELSVKMNKDDNSGKSNENIDTTLKMDKEKLIEDVNEFDALLSQTLGATDLLNETDRKARINNVIEIIKKKNIAQSDIYLMLVEILSDIQVRNIELEPSAEVDVELFKEGYPLGGRFFGDKFYITNILEDCSHMAGGVITAINGIEFSDVVERYNDIIVNESDSDLKYQFEDMHVMGFFKKHLEYLGISKKDEVIFTIEKDGKVTDLKMTSANCEDFTKEVYFCMEDNLPKNNMWEVMYEESLNAPFYYKYDEGNFAMYIQINECNDVSTKEDAPSFTEFMNKLITLMKYKEGSYSQVIFDFRKCKGTDTSLIYNAMVNNAEFWGKQNIKIISGRNYDAGQIGIDSILLVNPNARIYGEESCNFIKTYAGRSAGVALKNSGWKLYAPTWVCIGSALKYHQENWYMGVQPDVYVALTYEDYLAGRDNTYIHTLNN